MQKFRKGQAGGRIVNDEGSSKLLNIHRSIASTHMSAVWCSRRISTAK